MKRMLALVGLVAVLCMFTACDNAIDSNPLSTSASTAPTTPPTFSPMYEGANETGVMTFGKLMNLASKKWSAIDGFEHTDVDANHAVFTVSLYDNGGDCTLSVTYDAASDALSEAVLTYKDTVSDALNNDPTFAARPIMQAMTNDMVQLDSFAGVAAMKRDDFNNVLQKKIDDTHVKFPMYSKTFEDAKTVLSVTFDAETGAVTEATLTYNDVNVNAFGNDLAALEILSTIQAEYE